MNITEIDSNLESHTVRSFDHDLRELATLVMKMGGLVQEQVNESLKALKNADADRARKVILGDQEVNRLDGEADELCILLLARRQPMGGDLRMIMGLNKVVSELERIGDNAKRIARMTIHLFENAKVRPGKNLLRDAISMGKLAKRLFKESLDTLARMDVEQAVDIGSSESELDAEFQSGLRRLATFLLEDSRDVGHIINATLLMRSIERIGEHAENITEHVIYIVKGKDVRHIGPDEIEKEVNEY